MAIVLHGGQPLIDGGAIAISSDCCCATGCTMPCAPYTGFSVGLTFSSDTASTSYSVPFDPDLMRGGIQFTDLVPQCTPPSARYCWPFASPPPAGPRMFCPTIMPWWVTTKQRKVVSGLLNLNFSVSLPLSASATTVGCCRFIPTGSADTISGAFKRYDLGQIIEIKEQDFFNYWHINETATVRVTNTYDAHIWLAASCSVMGLGTFDRTSSIVEVLDPDCDCGSVSIGLTNFGCMACGDAIGNSEQVPFFNAPITNWRNIIGPQANPCSNSQSGSVAPNGSSCKELQFVFGQGSISINPSLYTLQINGA